MSARINPIPASFSPQETSFLLVFEANELDKTLVEKRDKAYDELDLNLATKLETISHHSQKRLNRRFQKNLQFVH